MKFLEKVIVNPSISLKKGQVYPFVEMADVRPYARDPQKVNSKVFSSGSKFADGDTVIARITPCLQNGKAFYCHNIGEGFGSTEFIVFRPKDETLDHKYLYYLMQTSCIREIMIKSMVGSTGRQRVNNDIFKSIDIRLPDLQIQKKIANILYSYDDLIENNRKQIKLLEEAAQRLYKEWFVDLRFPGHEHTKIVDGVPEGWEKKQADACFDITIGKTPPRAEQQWFTNGKKGVPWVSISDMGNASTFIFDTSEELTADSIERYNIKIVPAGTVLLSFKLTVGRVSISGEDMCTNEAIAHFRIADQATREYAYCYLKNYPYDTLGSTSSISKAINSKIVKAMPFVMPSHAIVDNFSEYCRPLLEQIKAKQQIILNLQQARDRLLPKLMSGEVGV